MAETSKVTESRFNMFETCIVCTSRNDISHAMYIVYGIESAAYGVICMSCLCQKPERARYERVGAFDTNNECI